MSLPIDPVEMAGFLREIEKETEGINTRLGELIHVTRAQGWHRNPETRYAFEDSQRRIDNINGHLAELFHLCRPDPSALPEVLADLPPQGRELGKQLAVTSPDPTPIEA